MSNQERGVAPMNVQIIGDFYDTHTVKVVLKIRAANVKRCDMNHGFSDDTMVWIVITNHIQRFHWVDIPLSFSAKSVRNIVKLRGPGASLIMSSMYSSSVVIPMVRIHHCSEHQDTIRLESTMQGKQTRHEIMLNTNIRKIYP